MKKLLGAALCLLLCTVALAGCANAEREKIETYNAAKQLIEDGQLEQAYETFLTIQDYRDVSEVLERFVFRPQYYISEGTSVYMHYDSYGRLIKKEYSSGIASGVYMTKLYEYDEQGRMVKYTYLYGERPEENTLLEYDSRGNVVKVIEPDQSTQSYVYDDRGRLVSEIFANASGFVTSEIKYRYDDQENSYIKETCRYDGGPSYSEQCWLDQNGNMIKRVNPNNDVQEWEYNEQGQIIKYRTEDSIFKSISETTYTYDKYGGLASAVRVDHFLQENQTDLTYTTWYRRFYDEYGNLMSEKIEKSSAGGDSYIEYYDYRLYYDSCGVREIPEEYLGTGA